jgi:hypothetical protein
VRRGLAIGLIGALVAAAAFAPWLELPDSFAPLLNETTGDGYANVLLDHVALGVAGRVAELGGVAEDQARSASRAVERGLAVAVFVGYLAWEARRVWSEPTSAGVVRAMARSSLLYLLVASTAVQPWYFVLPLALAALLGWQDRLGRVIVGYSLLVGPALYLSYYLRELTPEPVFVIYGLVPLLLLLRRRASPSRRRARLASARGLRWVGVGTGSSPEPGRSLAGPGRPR